MFKKFEDIEIREMMYGYTVEKYYSKPSSMKVHIPALMTTFSGSDKNTTVSNTAKIFMNSSSNKPAVSSSVTLSNYISLPCVKPISNFPDIPIDSYYSKGKQVLIVFPHKKIANGRITPWLG